MFCFRLQRLRNCAMRVVPSIGSARLQGIHRLVTHSELRYTFSLPRSVFACVTYLDGESFASLGLRGRHAA